MKRIFTLLTLVLCALTAMAQGWPKAYQGVMLQGFYWDSFSDTQWTNLESQADELAEFFQLIWIPQSGKSANNGNSMGYDDLYWFTDYNSSFGNEEQLRSMIKTFKSKGLGTIADVVINHRSSMSGTWMSFPEETYNGVTYTMGAADICSNDDKGKTALNAEVKPTGAPDSGEDFDGARDIDHSSANVQTMVKAYLDFLLNDLGYAGFRYDMVKGYASSYTGMYNDAAKPEFSVGEYWDGNSYNLKRWIDGTAVDGVCQSAAFDFALKYALRDCCNASYNWAKMSNAGLIALDGYKRYAVTFVDNHDTYNRGNDSETRLNVLAANAYILAAPGTPCLFLPHWKSYKHELKQMIYARRMAGISSESDITELSSGNIQYAMKVDGADGASVIVLMGNKALPASVTAADYHLVSTGDNYAYYISKKVESAWVNVPSGTYDNAFAVTLNALTMQQDAQLVYTTDGTEPTATNGTQVADGTEVNITGGTTLKVGVLTDGKVSGIITRHYQVLNFQPHDITVYVKADWPTMYFHSWDALGNSTNWPGDKVTDKKTIDGVEWYYKTYTISSSDYYVNFVFNQGSNANQTVDVNNVKTDKYFEISTSKDGAGHYYVNDVTEQHSSGIGQVVADDHHAPLTGSKVYALDGRLVRSLPQAVGVSDAVKGLKKGIYIFNTKKIVVR